ncbi:MAG: ArnT family glycosyltransferase [Chthoniobacterales bacterium]
MKSATRNYALLFSGCLLFHLAGTWSLPLIDRDEPRFAEASREMIERDDYVVPHFNNDLRLDKPPLAYWAQIASYKIFGENDFAARLPSAVAAALIALSLFAWGRRIDGDRLGWWPAIIFTLSLQTFLHAKAAVADMWLVLFVTTAHWAGWELLTQGAAISRPPWAIWRSPFLVFYFSLALGFLAKGPIAWTPLLAVGLIIFFTRDFTLVRPFKFLRGILLMLAIVALWGIPALVQTDGEFWSVGLGRHVVARSLVTMEGHGPKSVIGYLALLPFYFVTIFVSFFPWSIKLPWLAQKLWRKQEAGVGDPGYSGRDKIDNYLLTGIAIIFVTFTLIKTKLPHYTLPAFPLLALLLARHWQPAAATSRRSVFGKIAIATASLWILVAIIVPPLVAGSFPAYALFQQARDELRTEMEFGAVDYAEPSLVWYFRSRAKGFFTPLNNKRAVQFMEKPGPRFVIAPTSLARTLFANHADWKTFSTQGINIAKGKHVDLTLVLKSE